MNLYAVSSEDASLHGKEKHLSMHKHTSVCTHTHTNTDFLCNLEREGESRWQIHVLRFCSPRASLWAPLHRLRHREGLF